MTLHSPFLPLFLILAFFSSGAVAQTDYTKRIGGESSVPKYAVPYGVPKPAEVKATLDRIKGYVVQSSTLKVFDNATGQELAAPDMNNLLPTAVVDRRYGNLNFWDYTNGVIMSGFSMIGDVTGDRSYFDYNVRFYDFTFTWMPYFRALEEKTNKRNDFSRMTDMRALDHCGAITAALIRTYSKHKDERYRHWIGVVDDYISNKQFRFEDGTLARERPQPRSVWTDDFYMGISFLSQMGKLTGEAKYYDDAVRQVVQLSARLFVEERGLYAHGWAENTHPYNPRFYWGRANGWATMAMAELLSVLPASHKGRDQVMHLYRSHLRTLAELQDGSGLWHNMLDKADTYLETSASAMFVYAMARGINEGWISHTYGPAAIMGWNAVSQRVLPDGRVDGICEGTTYANDNAYYYFRGAGPNTTFFGSVLFAGAEMIRLLQNEKIEILPPQPGAVNSAIHVKLKGAVMR